MDQEKNLREFETFLNTIKQNQSRTTPTFSTNSTTTEQQQRSTSKANVNNENHSSVESTTHQSSITLSRANNSLLRKTFNKQQPRATEIPSSTSPRRVLPKETSVSQPNLPNMESEDFRKLLSLNGTSLLRAATTKMTSGDAAQETTSEATSDYYSAAGAAASQPGNNKNLNDVDSAEFKSELMSKLISLDENEKKLKELYSLQSRLDGLKKIMGQFTTNFDSEARAADDEQTMNSSYSTRQQKQQEFSESKNLVVVGRKINIGDSRAPCDDEEHTMKYHENDDDDADDDADDMDADDDNQDEDDEDAREECPPSILEIQKDNLDLEEEKKYDLSVSYLKKIIFSLFRIKK